MIYVHTFIYIYIYVVKMTDNVASWMLPMTNVPISQ